MTIFMGYRTEDYVFGVIDSRRTSKRKNRTVYYDWEKKAYTLTNYNISFATTGRILRALPAARLGLELTDEINYMGSTQNYNVVTEHIRKSYHAAYKAQVKDDAISRIIIWGANATDNKTFLIVCSSPDFQPKYIDVNHAVYFGTEIAEYKQKGTQVLLSLKNDYLNQYDKSINLKEWAHETFDSVKGVKNVGYPLVINFYNKNGRHAGDAMFRSERTYNDKFNVLKDSFVL